MNSRKFLKAFALGLSNETVGNPTAANTNITSSYSAGTLSRVGLFARTTGSTRVLSGGTYYGVMDMGGNATEICINAVSATGLAFDGSLHGDGYLAASGNSNISNWTTYGAYGWRGGSATNAATTLRISDRSAANAFTSIYANDVVIGDNGIRLARTAP